MTDKLQQTSEALKQWFNLAEGEFADMMGLDATQAVKFQGRSNGAQFVQQSQNAGRASKHAHSSAPADKWRTMGAWATTLLRTNGASTPSPGALDFAKILVDKFSSSRTWTTADKPASAELTNFAMRFSRQQLADTKQLAYIVKVSNAMAKHLDEVTGQARRKEWKQHVAGNQSGCAKGAYAYAKEPIGFAQSPTALPASDDEGDSDDEPTEALCDAAVTRLHSDAVIFRGISSTPTHRADHLPNCANPSGGAAPLEGGSEPARSGQRPASPQEAVDAEAAM